MTNETRYAGSGIVFALSVVALGNLGSFGLPPMFERPLGVALRPQRSFVLW